MNSLAESTCPEPIPSPAIDLSVVIPCGNAAAYLATQLEAVAAQQFDGNWEVILADNGSTDGSKEIARQFLSRIPNFRIVDAIGPKTAAFARNVGVEHAHGEIIVFVDADDEMSPGYVTAMATALRQHGLVCSRIDISTLNPPDIYGEQPSLQWDGPPQWLNNVKFLPYAPACSLGIRRSLFRKLGGFDVELPTSEEVDLCWRAQLDQHSELHFAPEAVLRYRCRDGLWRVFRRQYDYGRDEVLMYKRFRPAGIRSLSWRENFYQWKALLLQLPAIGNRSGRTAFVTNLGHRVGRIAGSLRYRTFLL